jgi:hypothetical protein
VCNPEKLRWLAADYVLVAVVTFKTSWLIASLGVPITLNEAEQSYRR